jgi:hypothetical protein
MMTSASNIQTVYGFDNRPDLVCKHDVVSVQSFIFQPQRIFKFKGFCPMVEERIEHNTILIEEIRIGHVGLLAGAVPLEVLLYSSGIELCAPACSPGDLITIVARNVTAVPVSLTLRLKGAELQC